MHKSLEFWSIEGKKASKSEIIINFKVLFLTEKLLDILRVKVFQIFTSLTIIEDTYSE